MLTQPVHFDSEVTLFISTKKFLVNLYGMGALTLNKIDVMLL